MSAYIREHERIKIETMLKDGLKPKEIAVRIGKHYTTIYREIKRGTVELLDSDTWLLKKEYCADVAQRKQTEKGHNKGINLKIGNDYAFVREFTRLVKQEKYSPYAALVRMEKEGTSKIRLCVTTLYNYIDSGIFIDINRSDLPYRKKKKQEYQELRHTYSKPDARRIEERPKEAGLRTEYGHWEMDTVYSGKGKSRRCLLVLTERQTRAELVFSIPDRTAKSVVKQFDRLEKKYGSRRFRNTFKTVTCDNGVEFSDYKGLERSVCGIRPRTAVYFCHPFCSSERGSNENANKLIRRHIPKGADIGTFSRKNIAYIQNWINSYPRKLFGGLSTYEYGRRASVP